MSTLPSALPVSQTQVSQVRENFRGKQSPPQTKRPPRRWGWKLRNTQEMRGGWKVPAQRRSVCDLTIPAISPALHQERKSPCNFTLCGPNSRRTGRRRAGPGEPEVAELLVRGSLRHPAPSPACSPGHGTFRRGSFPPLHPSDAHVEEKREVGRFFFLSFFF